MKFLHSEKPRLVPLKYFSPDTNVLSSKFVGCDGPEAFLSVWKTLVEPHLDKETGIFTENAYESLPGVSSEKRRSSSSFLMPATKIARKQSTSSFEDESSMDASIQEHFLGKKVVKLLCNLLSYSSH